VGRFCIFLFYLQINRCWRTSVTFSTYKWTVQARGNCNRFVTRPVCKLNIGPPLVNCPRLLVQFICSYTPYWRQFLHPQPEDVPCDGKRDPFTYRHGLNDSTLGYWCYRRFMSIGTHKCLSGIHCNIAVTLKLCGESSRHMEYFGLSFKSNLPDVWTEEKFIQHFCAGNVSLDRKTLLKWIFCELDVRTPNWFSCLSTPSRTETLNPQLAGNVCSRLRFMFPMETFELIKRLLTLNVAKPRQNAETFLNSYELFIYGNILYVTNSFCKNVLNSDTLEWLLNCIFYIFCSIIHVFLLHMRYRKKTQVNLYIKLYVYLFTLHSLHWISCCPHANQIFCCAVPMHWDNLFIWIVFGTHFMHDQGI